MKDLELQKMQENGKHPEEKEGFAYKTQKSNPDEDRLSEAKAEYAYHRQGEYTLEDYYALPKDQRVELIDGFFYDMAAPYTTHQIAVSEIHAQLFVFIRSKNGLCLALDSPIDVQLDCDDSTMVQPDVLVLCDRDKLKKRCIYGAPDFVTEILSDATARKDLTIKLRKYMNAGVREYWIVDLRQEKVIVYKKTEEGYNTSIYSMEQPVPVQIFAGECQIYFDRILEEVRPVLKQP